MHKTVIVGRVGGDPKPLGEVGCYFSIATERYNGSTKQRDTTWSKLKAFGKTAEIAKQYVTKGRLISVTCHYEVSEYNDTATGQKRQDHSFVIEDLELLPDGSRREENGGGFGRDTGPQQAEGEAKIW